MQALLGYILLEAHFAHANLPVMILNVIFLISHIEFLRSCLHFTGSKVRCIMSNKKSVLGHITHMSALQLQQHLAAKKT
jgi:hypothetical protein